MNRLGFRHDQLDRTMPPIAASSTLAIEGVYTHFATADVPDDPLFGEQRTRFEQARRTLAGLGIRPRVTHMANSAAMLRDERVWFDYVRPGLLLYGLVPPPLATTLALEPVMSLTSTVVSVKGVRPGEGVSYGMRFRTDVPRRIAVVPAGYADGIDTRSGNRGVVLVRGRRVPIVGAVCMDMMMIDVTDVEVEPGDEVVIVGQQGAERLDMREIAATIGAIPWELLCRIGSRIERVYAGGRRRRQSARIEPWPRPRRRRPSTRARSAAPSRRSGWAAAPSAAPGTRWSRSAPRRRSRPAAPRRATRRRRSGPAGRPPRSATPTSAWPPSIASRPASPSSIACSAAASSRDRWCCSAASPASASRRCCCRPRRTSPAPSGPCSTPRARRASRRSRRAASGSASATIRCYLFAETCLERVLDEAVRLKPALLVLDSIQTVFSTKLQSAPGSVGPGARGGDAAPVRRQGPARADVHHRPRHQGRRARRAQGARARRRHGALLRGRAPPRPSRRARGEEPLRRGVRGRRLRDDRRRPAAGAEPVGAVPGRAARPRRRLRGAVRDRRLAAAAGRGAGARQHQHLRLRQAAPPTASTPTACRCSWRCSRSAPGWSCRATTSSPTSPAACRSTSRRSISRSWPRWPPACATGRCADRRRCSARSAWPARCAARRTRALRVREAARLGFTRVILPPDSVPKADVPAGVTLVPVASVGELLDALFE